MNARLHWIAYAAITIPSISWCGSRSTSMRSLNVDGSPSSALTTRYRGNEFGGRNDHFCAAGKPAPPRPRIPASFTCSWMFAVSPARSTSRSTSYAPVARAPATVHESSGRSCIRRVRIRVSSTNRGSRDRARVALAPLVLLDDRLGRRRRDVLVVLVVHLQRGCAAARGDALDLFDGHLRVGGVARLEVLEDLRSARDEAGHVRAHRDDEPSARPALEHCVERARAEHDGGGDAG